MPALSIITIGHVHVEDVMPLGERFAPLEQLVLDLHPRADIDAHRAELNRAVDASTADWLLIVRERETVDAALAKELLDVITAEPARAWGFRIRTQPLYAGQPLRLGGDDAGELRLFHRRHFLRRGELAVQGTVIRLASPFRAVTFATPAEHHDYLAKSGVPHSVLRRTLLFLRNAIASRTADRNTLRYLWIDAGFDKS